MKEIKKHRDEMPECDLCGIEIAKVIYNTPTKLGPWGNLCADCMPKYGIATSVTEKLVRDG